MGHGLGQYPTPAALIPRLDRGERSVRLIRVMLRQNPKRFAIVLLLAGLALRAIAPLGYMPSTFGSGYLFELCPDQLPVGFTFVGSSSNHHHHDPANAESSENSADLCDFGHLLISAVGDDSPAIDLFDSLVALAVIPAAKESPDLVAPGAYHSRAPPA